MKHLDTTSRSLVSASIVRQLPDAEVLTRSRGYRLLVRDATGSGGSDVAATIGSLTGRTVYAVDLADLASKDIGETEKNLDAVLERAAEKDWILLVDEADALLDQRTDVRSVHDRYANVETSHVLQAIEQHRGIVILATNLKSSIDASITRRFESTMVTRSD